MTGITLLGLAEGKFDASKVEVALKLANLAKNLSNYTNVDKYCAAYKFHLASITKKTKKIDKIDIVMLVLKNNDPSS